MAVHSAVLNTPPETAEHIVRIVRQSMRCLIRLFGHHLSMRAFLQIAKQVAVEEACAQVKAENPDRKVSLSAMAVATGLDTRDIKQIQQEDNQLPERDVCPEAALLSRWARDPMFRDKVTDKPMDLTVYGKMGTFQGLARQYLGRGVTPDVAIKHLAARGCVKMVNHNWVRLLDPNWRWISEDERGLLENAKNVMESITATLLHNSADRDADEKWTERRVFSFHIPPENHKYARQLINQQIRDQFNKTAELLRSLEKTGEGACLVIGAGYYYWECDSVG